MSISNDIKDFYEESRKNLSNGLECQSCMFQRVICMQEGKCLSELEELYRKYILKK